MLEINKLLARMITKPEVQSSPEINTEVLGKRPTARVVKMVIDALDTPKTKRQITELSAVTYPVISVAIRYMIAYGDILSSGGKSKINTLTGSTKLIDELSALPHRSNMKVTGVSFNTKSHLFHVSSGRSANFTFNNFLDAVCKRKSLELGV